MENEPTPPMDPEQAPTEPPAPPSEGVTAHEEDVRAAMEQHGLTREKAEAMVTAYGF